jgi:MFS family permease
MVSEIIPAERRGRYIAYLEGFWPIGFIASGLLIYFVLSVAEWHWVFMTFASARLVSRPWCHKNRIKPPVEIGRYVGGEVDALVVQTVFTATGNAEIETHNSSKNARSTNSSISSGEIPLQCQRAILQPEREISEI